MIFHENISSTRNNILPPIQTNKKEKEAIEESKEKPTIIKENKYQGNNLTIDVNTLPNNRYNTSENISNENYIGTNKNIDKDNEKGKYSKAQTISNSRTITNSNIIDNDKNPFLAKVELDNIRSKQDCIYLLEDYLRTNNINSQYEVINIQDKIIFSFEDEKTAFEFTKIIYKEKNRNSLYKNVLVHLSLLPNTKYLRRQKLERKKRGLSYESIDKLYKGSSYIKKIKEFPKIKGNINLGLKSPFYNVLDSIKNKNKSNKTFKNKNILSRNNDIGDIYSYMGYDGKPLKSYEKLRISVLDTHYNPFCNFRYREDNKKKWVSPSNFKFY